MCVCVFPSSVVTRSARRECDRERKVDSCVCVCVCVLDFLRVGSHAVRHAPHTHKRDRERRQRERAPLQRHGHEARQQLGVLRPRTHAARARA